MLSVVIKRLAYIVTFYTGPCLRNYIRIKKFYKLFILLVNYVTLKLSSVPRKNVSARFSSFISMNIFTPKLTDLLLFYLKTLKTFKYEIVTDKADLPIKGADNIKLSN